MMSELNDKAARAIDLSEREMHGFIYKTQPWPVDGEVRRYLNLTSHQSMRLAMVFSSGVGETLRERFNRSD